MSMPVNNARIFAYISIPLILLIILTGLVIWQTMQTSPLAIAGELRLHQAIDFLKNDIEDKQPFVKPTSIKTTGKDPFLRYKQTVIEKSIEEQPTILEEITLSTIANGAQGRYCLINGTIYFEGQQSQYFHVKEIRVRDVVFEIGGKTFSLAVGKKGVIENGQLVPYTPEASD